MRHNHLKTCCFWCLDSLRRQRRAAAVMERAGWWRDRAPAAASLTSNPRRCSQPQSNHSPEYWRGNLPAHTGKRRSNKPSPQRLQKVGLFYLVHLPVVLLILRRILRDLWINKNPSCTSLDVLESFNPDLLTCVINGLTAVVRCIRSCINQERPWTFEPAAQTKWTWRELPEWCWGSDGPLEDIQPAGDYSELQPKNNSCVYIKIYTTCSPCSHGWKQTYFPLWNGYY